MIRRKYGTDLPDIARPFDPPWPRPHDATSHPSNKTHSKLVEILLMTIKDGVNHCDDK